MIHLRLQGEVFICMELMDMSIEAVYKNAFSHGYKISEDFLRKLSFSVCTWYKCVHIIDSLNHLANTDCSMPLWKKGITIC